MRKKTHKKVPRTITSNRYLLKFGSHGFKILSSIRLQTEQINSLERNLNRKLKDLSNHSKNYKFWYLIKTNKTLTKLSLESRMGKGKGDVFTEVLFLKKGSIIYELQNFSKPQLQELIKFIEKQMSINLALISKK